MNEEEIMTVPVDDTGSSIIAHRDHSEYYAVPSFAAKYLYIRPWKENSTQRCLGMCWPIVCVDLSSLR